MESQKTKVLKHLLRYGSITSKRAFESYGITRLSSIIYRLREHYCIETHMKYGKKENYAKYIYVGPREKEK